MNEPKIRFKGFQGEWKKVLVGSLGTTYSGLSGKTKDDFGFGEARFVTFLNVLTNAIIDTSILEPVNVIGEEHQNTVNKGDLLFNTSSETPKEVGMCAVMDEELANVYLNSFCFGFRVTDENIVPSCVAYLMRSQTGRRIMSILAQGATRYNLSKKSFCKTELLLPKTKAEQQFIASYFQYLDALIQSTTKKIESLKQVKAASLQSMFPQEGETTPRVRFKGFEGEWEKVKLGDVLNYEQPSKYLVTNTEYEKSGIPVLTAGKTFVLGYTSDTFGLYTDLPVIIFDDFTTESKFVDFLFKVKSSAMKMLNTVHDMDVDIKFVYEAMKNIQYRVENHQRHWLAVFSKITIKIPSIAEQRAIASYFTNLDRQITLQNQRLEKLKQIKAACLDKMFV